VYALTREGKKLPLGYYVPNDGSVTADHPIVAQATADAAVGPESAIVANLRAKAKRSPTGIPVVRGKRWGHPRPPKRYRQMGATRPGDYAYPERFMYPLFFRDASGRLNTSKSRRHVANAKTRFSAHKQEYPMAIRHAIARRINKAARRVGLAADVRP
jgi:hypothetical protein